MRINVHEKNRPMDEQAIVEMSNKWQEETGLPMNIWVDEAQWYLKGRHSKRLKFQLDTSDALKTNLLGEMDLDGNVHPKTLKIPGLKQRHITQLQNFVHNNKYALEQIADMNVRLYEIWDYIIKGGDIVTDEQIKNLNDKVDEFIAKRK